MLKKVSIALGFMIFMFGFLKFFEPFKSWYSIQIQTSGLPAASHLFGILGEIFVGIVLLISSFTKNEKLHLAFSTFGSLGLITIMGVAIYVHLIPEVPAEVLPLKIKSPIIPILVLLASLYNLNLALKSRSLANRP